MIRRPQRSTRTDTSFPTRRSSDLATALSHCLIENSPRVLQVPTVRQGFVPPTGSAARSVPTRREPSRPPPADRSSVRSRPSHGPRVRSEEHTSELQSLMRISYAVFCLKTKKKISNEPQAQQ